MSFDWGETHGAAYWERFRSMADEADWPERVKWDDAARQHPAVAMAVLRAQKKKSLAAAFEAKWRSMVQTEMRTVAPKHWEWIERPDIRLELLPEKTWLIELEFTLSQDMMTKDDSPFEVTDNPIRKERVFEKPYLAAASWKGALVSAMFLGQPQLFVRETEEGEERIRRGPQMIRLFGNDRDVEDTEQLRRGRLQFYPSFFNRRGFAVLNPHERETGAGKNPIHFETVPRGARGRFELLYVPPAARELTTADVLEDLVVAAQGVHDLLRVYGFGAKTSSGFGQAADRLQGGRIGISLGGSFRKLDLSMLSQLPAAGRRIQSALLQGAKS